MYSHSHPTARSYVGREPARGDESFIPAFPQAQPPFDGWLPHQEGELGVEPKFTDVLPSASGIPGRSLVGHSSRVDETSMFVLPLHHTPHLWEGQQDSNLHLFISSEVLDVVPSASEFPHRIWWVAVKGSREVIGYLNRVDVLPQASGDSHRMLVGAGKGFVRRIFA